jgi:integrase
MRVNNIRVIKGDRVVVELSPYDLRRALAARGHTDVALAHYGALRGTNAYVGHDVILAQAYHPNLEQIIREGRALFADDDTPLDERLITVERTLTDGTGASWAIPVPTFADSRLAALLESRREHELVQAALRGRPLDHPDTQITLLFGMPLPGLAPTVIAEAPTSSASNAGRQAAARAALLAATQQLLEGGTRQIDVQSLAAHAGVSVVTVRAHWQALAARLHLRSFT